MKIRVPIQKSTANHIHSNVSWLFIIIYKTVCNLLAFACLCFIFTGIGLVIGSIFMMGCLGVSVHGFNEALTLPIPVGCAILVDIVVGGFIIKELNLIEFEYTPDKSNTMTVLKKL
jgi:hypothetical protein